MPDLRRTIGAVLLEPMLFPLLIGVTGAVALWTLRRLVPEAASSWIRPPGRLLPFWFVGIALALVMGGIPWVGLIQARPARGRGTRPPPHATPRE